MGSGEDAKQEIERAIATEWASARRPLLISQLGMRLSQETKAALSETGQGLKRYIQDNLEDRVRFVPMRGRGGGVAPLDQTRDLGDEQLEAFYDRRSAAEDSQAQIPKYWGDVWRGFQNELPEGLVRYLILDASGKPEVVDAPEGTQLPANATVIGRDDLVLAQPSEPRPLRSAVHGSIEEWRRREGIPPNCLVFDRPQSLRRPDASAEPRRHSTASNASQAASLMHGLDLLSRDELARISIPADLVVAMLERSSSR